MTTFGNALKAKPANDPYFDIDINLENIEKIFSKKLIGQNDVPKKISSYVQLFHSGLNPKNRPTGIFLLTGPSGTGKTQTIKILAELLHGDENNFLKIDCGEYQMDHEVARLIGAPPGYLGHRETQPLLSQARINANSSKRFPLTLILFDEIEKAADSFHRLLLGAMDSGVIRLGDNSLVSFEKTMFFFTSNLGGREISSQLSNKYSFKPTDSSKEKINSAVEKELKKKFLPEFLNRIDEKIFFNNLSPEDIEKIYNLEIQKIHDFIHSRLGPDFHHLKIKISRQLKEKILKKGYSPEYGVRELKRVLNRLILVNIAKEKENLRTKKFFVLKENHLTDEYKTW